MVNNLPVNAGDVRGTCLIPGSGRYPGGGHGNPLQYSCLENPMDRGAWQATVHRVTQCQTQLKRLSTHADIHYYCYNIYIYIYIYIISRRSIVVEKSSLFIPLLKTIFPVPQSRLYNQSQLIALE